jgi:hypothetical protein
MLELLLCSLLTILPDYLYRRYAQGKRFGKEITLYSVWFELRWGITACLMLTVGLITVIFYNHPSTSSATLFFRSVPIVSEINGRVAEVYLGPTSEVKQGAPIFRLDSSTQEAAAEAARRKIAEVDAALVVARSDVAAADGKTQEARSAYQQAVDDLATKQEINRRNPGTVSPPGISSGSRSTCRGARARSMPPPPPSRRPRRRSPRSSRPRRPAPKPRWLRLRRNWRSPSSGPA